MIYECNKCSQEFRLEEETQTIYCPVCNDTVQLQRVVQYASFWRRGGAFIIDFGLWWGSNLIVSLPLALLGDDLPVPVAAGLGLLMMVWVIASPILIFILPLRLWNGQTIGKRALGIVVVREDGLELSWGQAIARFFLYFVSYITVFVGFLWCIWDERKRCLHDIIAKTFVVRSGEQTAIASERKAIAASLEAALEGEASISSPLSTAPTDLEPSTARGNGEYAVLNFPIRWRKTTGINVSPRKGAIELHKDRLYFWLWTPRLIWLIVYLVLALLTGILVVGGVIAAPASQIDQTCGGVIFYGLGVVFGLYFFSALLAEKKQFKIPYKNINSVEVNSKQGTVLFSMEINDPKIRMRDVDWIGKPDALIRMVTVLKDKLDAGVITTAD